MALDVARISCLSDVREKMFFTLLSDQEMHLLFLEAFICAPCHLEVFVFSHNTFLLFIVCFKLGAAVL